MSKAMAALAAFTTLFFSFNVFAGPPVEWGFQKLPAAMAEAKVSNKPVFVLFGHETCMGCKRLYSNALLNSDLRETFQKSFVLAYVDTDGNGEPSSYQMGDGSALSHADLLALFKGTPTPSWVFLTSKGVRLHGERGGKTQARDLMRDGEIALEKFKASAAGG